MRFDGFFVAAGPVLALLISPVIGAGPPPKGAGPPPKGGGKFDVELYERDKKLIKDYLDNEQGNRPFPMPWGSPGSFHSPDGKWEYKPKYDGDVPYQYRFGMPVPKHDGWTPTGGAAVAVNHIGKSPSSVWRPSKKPDHKGKQLMRGGPSAPRSHAGSGPSGSKPHRPSSGPARRRRPGHR